MLNGNLEKNRQQTESQPPANEACRIGNLISAFRKFMDHPVVGMGNIMKPEDPARGAFSKYEAWHWMIFESAFTNKEIDNKGRTIKLQRGELIAARDYLAKTWNWNPHAVRWFLDRLVRESMIIYVEPQVVTASAPPAIPPAKSKTTASKSNLCKVVRLCNYDIFQTVYELDKLTNRQQNPISPPAVPPDYIYTTTTKGPKTEIPDLRQFIREISNAAGNSIDQMRNLILDTSLPQSWVTKYGCDLLHDILPTLRRLSQGKRSGSIKTWEYFHDAVLDAKEQRCRPAKERVVKKPAQQSNGRSTAEGMLELMKKQYGAPVRN